MGTSIILRLAESSKPVAIFVVAAMAGAAPALADDSVNTGYFGGAAIMGYDPVAYFTDGKAVKGSEEFTYDWLGTPWLFASKKHQEMFMSDPAKYAPQFGGYCAGEVAGTGSVTINVDPKAFNIIQGKLYLNYDQGTAGWLASNAKDAVPTATTNWPIVKAKLAVDKPNWDSINKP
jgi:YHS domain-containing protein